MGSMTDPQSSNAYLLDGAYLLAQFGGHGDNAPLKAQELADLDCARGAIRAGQYRTAALHLVELLESTDSAAPGTLTSAVRIVARKVVSYVGTNEPTRRDTPPR